MHPLDIFVLHFSRLGPAGLSPKAPGTAGSFLAVLLAPFLFLPLPFEGRLIVLTAVFFAGGFAASRAEILLGAKDPGCIVIDELLGQWTAMLCLSSIFSAWSWNNVLFLLIPFFFFRLFDIWKPWPVHASENWLPGGWGIMIDDLFAGLWALPFVLAAKYLCHNFGIITL